MAKAEPIAGVPKYFPEASKHFDMDGLYCGPEAPVGIEALILKWERTKENYEWGARTLSSAKDAGECKRKAKMIGEFLDDLRTLRTTENAPFE